jgi:hypothetical protein
VAYGAVVGENRSHPLLEELICVADCAATIPVNSGTNTRRRIVLYSINDENACDPRCFRLRAAGPAAAPALRSQTRAHAGRDRRPAQRQSLGSPRPPRSSCMASGSSNGPSRRPPPVSSGTISFCTSRTTVRISISPRSSSSATIPPIATTRRDFHQPAATIRRASTSVSK